MTPKARPPGWRERFPDIKDPYETTVAEASLAAKLLANRGLASGTGTPAVGWRPTGEPLVARDAYGSRFLLVAPFSYGQDRDREAPDHWYAWDIDSCWIDAVVNAGVFGSAEDALREWRDAVGAAASGTTLSPSAPETAARLLAPCLETGPLSDLLQGSEPRELIREYYRLRRRARDLVGAIGSPAARADAAPFDADPVLEAFLGWYAAQGGDVPAAEDVGTILQEWGPRKPPDERSFYACSPHRIEMRAPDPRRLPCRRRQRGSAAAAIVDAVVHRAERARWRLRGPVPRRGAHRGRGTR